MLCMYKKRPNWDETQEFILEDDLSGKVAEHCDQLFGSEPQNTGRNTVSNQFSCDEEIKIDVKAQNAYFNMKEVSEARSSILKTVEDHSSLGSQASQKSVKPPKPKFNMHESMVKAF